MNNITHRKFIWYGLIGLEETVSLLTGLNYDKLDRYDKISYRYMDKYAYMAKYNYE